MITHGLRTLLLAQSSITTLAPAQTIKRISTPAIVCDSAPLGMQPPYVVITDIRKDPMLTLDGTYGMTATEIDIDSYGFSEPSARTLSDTIRQFIDDYSGAAGDSDTINAVLWQDRGYSYDFPAEGRDTRYHIITDSFLIQHS